LLTGLIVGLGAVTVIDWHGFLARNSVYWTEATIRTHKVTKPLIWVGTLLVCIGGMMFYRNEPLSGAPLYHLIILTVLVINGMFLSFSVSPYLLERERLGKAGVLLPRAWQRKVFVSFLISDIGWWSGLIILVWYIGSR
jgi:hypothetical protein